MAINYGEPSTSRHSKEVDKIRIGPESTIKEVIETLNNTSSKILLVTEGDGFLIGVITDGDIRRGLLAGLTLTDKIARIIQKNPITLSETDKPAFVIETMLLHKIQHIPILDNQSRVVGVYSWNELAEPVKRDNIMMIMAGGRGTRLYPKTLNTPKPMLEINGRPVLEHILEHAKSEGFTNFVFAIHHLGKTIRDYFGDGNFLNVKIDYIEEEEPLGTAGALSLLNPLPKKPLIVTNGDVLSRVRYGDLLDHHLTHGADATMAVQTYEWQNSFGEVQIDGLRIVDYKEKPVHSSLINAGVYVLEPKMLSLLGRSDYCDMPTLFEKIRLQGSRCIAFPIHETWIDIGRHDDLERAETVFGSKRKQKDKG